MTTPTLVTASTLHLTGAEPPTPWTMWHLHDRSVSLVFPGADNQSIGFNGSPDEVRAALQAGLDALDRAVAERDLRKAGAGQADETETEDDRAEAAVMAADTQARAHLDEG
jgi:hypothetical protein